MATPDGKSRNKKKFLGYLLQAYLSLRKRDVWSNGLRRVTSNLAILPYRVRIPPRSILVLSIKSVFMVLYVSHLNLIIHFSDREQRYSFLTHHDSPLSSSQGEGIPHSGNIKVERLY